MTKNNEVAELTTAVRELITKIDTLLSRVAIPARSLPQPDLSLLTAKEKEFFLEIEAVEGSGVAARKKVQKMLDGLEGHRLTEAFVRRLAQVMRERTWGVLCSCGEKAQFMWQKNKKCAEGGLLVLSHKTRRRVCTHDSTTTFRRYTLVDRPDGRSKRQ